MASNTAVSGSSASNGTGPRGGPILDADLAIVTSWFCPFTQRVLIALNEKGSTYREYEVSFEELFSNKPEWLLRMNPAGLIPILAFTSGNEENCITESLVCNEFLEDYIPLPKLLPDSAFDRAGARALISRIDAQFAKLFFRILTQQSQQGQREAADKLDVELKWLSVRLDISGGPFILGAQFSLVDCALLPFLLRLYILDHYRGYKVPDGCSRLTGYVLSAVARASVRRTMKHSNPGEEYQEAMLVCYRSYADGSVT